MTEIKDRIPAQRDDERPHYHIRKDEQPMIMPYKKTLSELLPVIDKIYCDRGSLLPPIAAVVRAYTEMELEGQVICPEGLITKLIATGYPINQEQCWKSTHQSRS